MRGERKEEKREVGRRREEQGGKKDVNQLT